MTNPFAPGFGLKPPFLAGRDDALGACRATVERMTSGGAPDPVFISGLHGVGKTALLEAARIEAKRGGALAVSLTAQSGGSLFGHLVGPIRAALARCARAPGAAEMADRALRGLASFSRTHARQGLSALSGVYEPLVGLADSGDLEADAGDLLGALAGAAASCGLAVVIYVDDLDRASPEDVSALCSAIRRQGGAPEQVGLVASGITPSDPRLKSVAEQLGPIRHISLGPLTLDASILALKTPTTTSGVKFTDQAMTEIIAGSGRHPFFLQQWASSVISLTTGILSDRSYVDRARLDIEAELDQRFFSAILAEVTPTELRYLRAVAELDEEVSSTSAAAARLGAPMTALAPARASLIAKRVLYSPARGRAAFAAPGLRQFVLRLTSSSRA